MKMVFMFLITGLSINGFSQATSTGKNRTNQNKTLRNSPNPNNTGAGQSANDGRSQNGHARETATDRYLNGSGNKNGGSNSSVQNTPGNSSPFATGMRAANNAGKSFDTLRANTDNNNMSGTSNTASATVAGGNDTTFNANTLSGSSITTNSGAVDRSGQAQFGQTNWGSGRGTVGESQWTVPPPITASFNHEFPAINNATWTRNNVDTTVFSARYKNGASWVTSNYNASGEKLDIRTEFPLPQPPRPVSMFIAKQPKNFQVTSIYRVQVQGKPEVYELQTKTGKTVYVNNDGMEVSY
jgi:hypothetical protein